MKNFSIFLRRTALVLTFATFAFAQSPASARDIFPVRVTPIIANAGSTATLTATTNPAVFKASASGVIQSSSLGTCVNNAELEVKFPTAPDQPIVANGTATWTTIDGASSLKVTVSGTAAPDPANPGFLNVKYKVTITGGTGIYASATGVAEIEEVVMFTSPTTATATWNMKGFLVTPR
jgi:hypothetical protein